MLPQKPHAVPDNASWVILMPRSMHRPPGVERAIKTGVRSGKRSFLNFVTDEKFLDVALPDLTPMRF
jgi:hypothetical protein